MALVPHRITALAESDAEGTDGKNIIAGAVVSLFDTSGAAVTLFDNESGGNGSTTKQTDSSGQVVVWVTPGEYSESVNGSTQRAVTIGGRTVTSYANTESLQNSRPTQTGQRAENRERSNAQYELAEAGYTATIRDITSVNGRVWKFIDRETVKPFSDKLELRDSPKSYGYDNALIYNDDISGGFRWDENSTIPDNNETSLFSNSGNSVGRWLSDDFKFDYRQPQANVIPNLKSNISDGQFSDSINILGDSITHGANVEDIHNDSYAGVLRKLTNIEFSGSNIGFVTINDTISNSEGTYQEIHTVTRSGTWLDKTLDEASDSISGYKLTSNVAGSTLTIAVPTLNKSFKVAYIRNSTAGTFTVSTDGGSTVLATVNTQGAQGNLFTSSFPLEDLGSGLSEITIEVISGTVDITGIKYFDEANSPTFNVFAQSGRKIQFMSDEVIELASKTNRMLFFSLGFNDAGATGSDQDAVIERLEYLAARCKENFTKLVVSDFLWGISYDHWLRVKLRELAIAVNGATYIPFPDLFKREGYRIASGTLRDTYGFLSDGAHPTKLGHRIIAETLAKCVGYSSSSKLSAIMFNPVWTPLNLVNGWSNTFNSSRYVTAWRRNGNSLQLRVALNQSSSTDSLFAEMPDGFINVPLTENKPCSDASGNIFTLQAGLGLSSNLKILNAGSAGNNLVAQIEIPINNDFDYILI